MFRVWYNEPNFSYWIENVPASEALVYKEEGFFVIRMDLPFSTPPL